MMILCWRTLALVPGRAVPTEMQLVTSLLLQQSKESINNQIIQFLKIVRFSLRTTSPFSIDHSHLLNSSSEMFQSIVVRRFIRRPLYQCRALSTLPFDTLKFVRTLESKGFTGAQAEVSPALPACEGPPLCLLPLSLCFRLLATLFVMLSRAGRRK